MTHILLSQLVKGVSYLKQYKTNRKEPTGLNQHWLNIQVLETSSDVLFASHPHVCLPSPAQVLPQVYLNSSQHCCL